MKYNELSESAKDNALTNVMERVDDGDETWYYDEISRVETKLKEEGFNNPKVEKDYMIECDTTKITDNIYETLNEYYDISVYDNVGFSSAKDYAVDNLDFKVISKHAVVTDHNPQLEELMKDENFQKQQAHIISGITGAVEYYFWCVSHDLEEQVEFNYTERERLLQELAEDEIDDYDFDENGRIVE